MQTQNSSSDSTSCHLSNQIVVVFIYTGRAGERLPGARFQGTYAATFTQETPPAQTCRTSDSPVCIVKSSSGTIQGYPRLEETVPKQLLCRSRGKREAESKLHEQATVARCSLAHLNQQPTLEAENHLPQGRPSSQWLSRDDVRSERRWPGLGGHLRSLGAERRAHSRPCGAS